VSNQLDRAVDKARVRLAAASARRLLRRAGWALLVAATAVGASRPWLWPRTDGEPLWIGVPRALFLLVATLLSGALLCLIVGRLRRPSRLTAARAVDSALGLSDVLASGIAFEDDREGMRALACRRAESACADLDVRRLLRPPPIPLRPTWMLALLGCFLLASVVGAYDSEALAVILEPPTEAEHVAAARLEEAARRMERETSDADEAEPRRPGREKRPDARPSSDVDAAMVTRAQAAAAAARRGDRAGAMRQLEAIRRQAESREREASALERALRRLSSALGADGDGSSGSGEAERLRAIARALTGTKGVSSSASSEAERAVTNLAVQASKIARAGEPGAEQARRLAEALERAASELSRGDRSGAARQLEEAARVAEAMARARAGASRDARALARLHDAAAGLDRALQLAQAGRSARNGGRGSGRRGPPIAMPGSPREGGGAPGSKAGGLSKALAARLAALGLLGGKGTPGPGPGGHIPDSATARRGAMEAARDGQARSHVGAGDRAVLAIEGLGRSEGAGDSYEEVFPEYAAMAEASVDGERIPARRREAVRRYFEAIRPGGATTGAAGAGGE